MTTLLELMNKRKQEQDNAVIFKNKLIDFLNTKEIRNILSEAVTLNSGYRAAVVSGRRTITLNSDKSMFNVKITDVKNTIMFDSNGLTPPNEILDVDIKLLGKGELTNEEDKYNSFELDDFSVEVHNYDSQNLNPDDALDYFKNVIGVNPLIK